VNVPLHNTQRCWPEQERSLAQIKSPIRFGQEARRPNPKRRGCRCSHRSAERLKKHASTTT